ncbi:putative Kinetochore protein NUF2 [Monocercomonoides exilis]|uniref:putative Kinetochore protein NUF2 n=1 Tax=Monocercomonoides exilis TaxID=2049356 RepID=UPI003559CE13|nr:putative Kinetochore protein NUF2 [Monocercomonoides exilis]|eukprot:MONOS_12939.1-p1 / transcript=MONOS_12939.1 / gene=MONOS_12939 / organism=Monocercomonoides_exilis_PA203 / gene_product=Kinetochore protein NUF2 / transcript_product=Kinetochore protein NUF2 / location=Mono_scaffold00756:13074-14012(-) / protein_length=206 / sequence_SO=supercontig / SO=protein_coding / is_pseudo=false
MEQEGADELQQALNEMEQLIKTFEESDEPEKLKQIAAEVKLAKETAKEAQASFEATLSEWTQTVEEAEKRATESDPEKEHKLKMDKIQKEIDDANTLKEESSERNKELIRKFCQLQDQSAAYDQEMEELKRQFEQNKKKSNAQIQLYEELTGLRNVTMSTENEMSGVIIPSDGKDPIPVQITSNEGEFSFDQQNDLWEKIGNAFS